MKDLLENELFCTGISVGISLCQQILLTAHERGEPLIVGDNLYYLQSGDEMLDNMIDKICK